MRISDWSSDVCSSDLHPRLGDPLSKISSSCRDIGKRLATVAIDRRARRCGRGLDIGRRPVQACKRLFSLAEHSATRSQFRSGSSYIRNSSQRSEEQTSDLQSLMSISYAVSCLKK